MFKKTKREFQVAGSFLGGRGLALVLIAVVLTVFEKGFGIGWYWAIPFLITASAGVFWAEIKLKELSDKRVFKQLDVVVGGLRYLGDESVSLARREFVCRVQSHDKTVNKSIVEHLCKTQKGHFFLLQYSHVLGVIYNVTVIKCVIEVLMESYPDVYELEFGTVEVA